MGSETRQQKISFLIWLLVTAALTAASLASARSARGAPLVLTPFVGRSPHWDCRSVTLERSNVIGYMGIGESEETVFARILYRPAGGRSASIDLRLTRSDADALRREVEALLRGVRPKPIQFRAGTDRDGECQIVQVSG